MDRARITIQIPRWVQLSTVGIVIAPLFIWAVGVDLEALNFGTNSASLADGEVTQLAAHAIDHLLLDWSATAFALFAGALLLAEYASRRQGAALLAGLVLLCSGAVDVLHSEIAIQASHSDMQLLAPASWAATRSIHAFALAAAFLMRPKLEGTQRSKWIGFAVALFAGAALTTVPLTDFIAYRLGPTLTPMGGGIIARPIELIPLSLQLVALAIFFARRNKGCSLFCKSLALMLVTAICGEVYMLVGSRAIFDHWFDAAHWLKILGYATPVGALLHFHYATRQELRDAVQDLARQVHARREAEALLAEQQARLQLALEASRIATFAYDPHKDSLSIDSNFQRVAELPEGTELATRAQWLHNVAPADRESVASAIHYALENRQEFDVVYAASSKDGRPLHLALRGRVMASDSGQDHLIGVCENVTLEREAEAARRRSEARLTKILDALPVAVMVLDADGAPIYANHSACMLSDAFLDYAPGASWVDLLGARVAGSDSLYPTESFPVTHALAGHTKVADDVLMDARDRRIPVQMTGTSVALEDDARFAIIVIQDISDQRSLEAEVVRAQKLEAVGRLAAGIAHEINTPTQFVSDNTHFVRDGFKRLDAVFELLTRIGADEQVDQGLRTEIATTVRKSRLAFLQEEIPKSVEQSLDGLNRIATIVRAMKEFSHPGEQSFTSTDLNRAIQTTVTVARNEWKYVADIEFVLAEDLPPVTCLPNDFNQVILNMVVNAAHAIGSVVGDGANGKGKITIVTAQDGDMAEVRITDSGSGMPEEVRLRIFDPFFTTKAVGKGTGQGLALAHTVIVDRHGGSINVTSAPGEGTTFTIRMPLAQVARSHAPRAA